MPNVNALKTFTKKKVNRSNVAENVKANAKKKVNRLKIKEKNGKNLAEQKLYTMLMRFNSELANNVVFSPVTQRLLSVRPTPVNAKKSIRKSSPGTAGRTARRQTAKAGAMTLARRGVPAGPAGNILDRLLRPR